ncbi:MAG TPA: phosphatidylglycerophosphatase A [Burkholderiales bacterium]|nr:phosphatidylglycerophosphatase A [Burkholderiales bacterium]
MTLPYRSPGRWLVRFAAGGFGAGLLPWAPGTFGTLAAVPVYLLLRETGPIFYAVTVAFLFTIGVWICGIAGRDIGDDAPSIVWDEIVGFLIAMFMVPTAWQWIVAGFVLFRIFDIVKPPPIRTVERRIHGGLGCMLDDALAGLVVLIILHGAAYYLSGNWQMN